MTTEVRDCIFWLICRRIHQKGLAIGEIYSIFLDISGLFKNVQMQGAQKTEPRGIYEYTLSGAVYNATQQMSVRCAP
jgi:hypothetical protein